MLLRIGEEQERSSRASSDGSRWVEEAMNSNSYAPPARPDPSLDARDDRDLEPFSQPIALPVDDILVRVMSSATLTSKGQITLPKAIRDRLALKQGDRLQVTVGPHGMLTLKREEPPPLENAYGMLQRLAKSSPASIREMRAAVQQRAKRKH
jgi:antitoxin PrlF